MPNPGLVTLAQLTTPAQQRSDQVDSAFLSAQEWTDNINASIQELYGILMQKYGDDYFVKLPPATIVTTGSDDWFPLPTDFLKLLGVDLVLSNAPNGYVTLRQFMFSERNRFALPNVQTFYGLTNLQYRLIGSQQQGTTADQLWLIPRASANQSLRVWYVPRLSILVNANDTWDGFNGWGEYVVVDAAIKAMQKEEGDCSVLMSQKAALIERIESEAANRNLADPQRVPDPNSSGGWMGADGGGW